MAKYIVSSGEMSSGINLNSVDSMTILNGGTANNVKVSCVIAEQVTLIFGDNGFDQFTALSGMGAFFDETSERIFEESGKGILVSL